MNPAPASPMPDSQPPFRVPLPLPPSQQQPSEPTQFVPLSDELAAPILPLHEVSSKREMFDPIQPIDLLPLAQYADPESARQVAAAVRDLQDLFDRRPTPKPPAPSTVCLGDLPTRNVEWLWPDRVPIGKITLLVGDPGVGKSLIALDIAARVTTGRAWPDAEQEAKNGELGVESSDSVPGYLRSGSAPGSVLLLSAEDDLSDTVRPRLEALDADCTRVIALTAVPATDQRAGEAGRTPAPCSPSPALSSFDLGRDVALLDRVLDSRPDCSLVIIDPISAYLGRAVENVNAEVRRIIAPLAELAARRRLAVVVISHLRKQQGAAIHRSMGSLAFVAAARTAWMVCKDSPTKAGYTAERRLLIPIKNNIAGDATGLACTIESHPYAGLPIVRWSPEPLDMDADAALMAAKPSAGRPADDRDEAARWLETQLAHGPRPSAEVEEPAVAHGFSANTLRRAFRHLRGEAVRTGFGPQGKWHWRLPSIDAQIPRPNFGHLCTDPQKNHARPEC